MPSAASSDFITARSIVIADPREYAWLLVRSRSLSRELLAVWNLCPWRGTFWLTRAAATLLRLLLLLVTALLSGALGFALLLLTAQIPVAALALLRPLLPSALWLVLWGGAAIILVGYLVLALVTALRLSSKPETAARHAEGAITRYVVPPTDGTWRSDQSLHVRHPASRQMVFAALYFVLGVLVQGMAVAIGPAGFTGDVTWWQWPLLFGERLLNTALLGLPASFLSPVSTIAPAGWWMTGLLVFGDILWAAGFITLMVLILAPAFRSREVFTGTARDLADYLENVDIATPDSLTIHRVAVVHPLDESRVITCTKGEFFERIRETKMDPETGSLTGGAGRGEAGDPDLGVNHDDRSVT